MKEELLKFGSAKTSREVSRLAGELLRKIWLEVSSSVYRGMWIQNSFLDLYPQSEIISIEM